MPVKAIQRKGLRARWVAEHSLLQVVEVSLVETAVKVRAAERTRTKLVAMFAVRLSLSMLTAGGALCLGAKEEASLRGASRRSSRSNSSSKAEERNFRM